MFDEINEYIHRHEEKLKAQCRTLKPIDDEEYHRAIEKVKESTDRMKNLMYDNDPDEAIKRLSAELSLK